MAKYKVTLQPANITKPEITREVIALNAKNAEEIAETFNKGVGAKAVQSIRIGGTQSTEQDLKDMVDVMNSAIREGNEEIYDQQFKAYVETVKSLKSHLNAVAWQKTKDLIPEAPVM